MAVTLSVAAVLLLAAGELWLEPDRFYYSPGEVARLLMRQGENFTGQPWEAGNIRRFEEHVKNNVVDLKAVLEDGTTDSLKVRMSTEGTHLLVMETDRSFVAMDGEAFTAHLKDEGLDAVFFQRQRANTSADSASEYFSRYTKLILQVGSKPDDTYKKKCNLPIEIIPDKNPAEMKKGDPVKFMILYQGKPLFGAKVKVWNRYNHRITVQNIYSQQDGFIETHISNPGTWMVSVANMVPSRDPDAQYRAFYGTLVFGIR